MTIKTTIVNSLLVTAIFILSMVAVSVNTSNQAFADNALPEITVYKTPTCGCCGKWVSHLESNGFKVNAINQNDLSSLKGSLNKSCNFKGAKIIPSND